MFKPDDLVRDVLSNHPETWEVFERHGICCDCRKSPPPVPLQHFVDKHCEGRMDEFIQELIESKYQKTH